MYQYRCRRGSELCTDMSHLCFSEQSRTVRHLLIWASVHLIQIWAFVNHLMLIKATGKPVVVSLLLVVRLPVCCKNVLLAHFVSEVTYHTVVLEAVVSLLIIHFLFISSCLSPSSVCSPLIKRAICCLLNVSLKLNTPSPYFLY